MLTELLSVLHSLEFEELGWMRVAGFGDVGDGLAVTLEVRFDSDELPAQRWQLRCAEAREYRFTEEPVETIALEDRHPLLLPYTERHAQLSFLGRPTKPSSVVGELWEVHQHITGGWLDFDEFLNSALPLTELLEAGSGVLAEGPRAVLAGYAGVLEKHRIQPSWVGERPPLRWHEGRWQEESPDLQALVWGKSFLVGRDFSVKRLSPVAA